MRIGDCTLVIAMLDVFGKGDLPNAPPGPLYDTDVATFRELSLGADSIDLSCVVLRHGGGYRIAGGLSYLGLWVRMVCAYLLVWIR